MKSIEIVIQNQSENLTLNELKKVVDFFDNEKLANSIYGVCKESNSIAIKDCFGDTLTYLT